jgi:hypothetical protein
MCKESGAFRSQAVDLRRALECRSGRVIVDSGEVVGPAGLDPVDLDRLTTLRAPHFVAREFVYRSDGRIVALATQVALGYRYVFVHALTLVHERLRVLARRV